MHDGSIDLKMKGKKKGNLKHTTHMNSIRIQLLKRLPDAIETFGYITKEHRQMLNLSKEHYSDAVAIVSGGQEIVFNTNNVILKKCVADGDYKLRRGRRSEIIMPVGKIIGFRKFDKIEYLGKEYFIKGKMSCGYAILMDIYGTAISLKPMAKFSKMKRISARKSWIINSKIVIMN